MKNRIRRAVKLRMMPKSADMETHQAVHWSGLSKIQSFAWAGKFKKAKSDIMIRVVLYYILLGVMKMIR